MLPDANISLLLIENDPACLEICRKIIEKVFPELSVHTALNPDEARDLFKDQHHDIVVSDIFPPRKDGIQIAREVCKLNPDTLVIFITGDTDVTWDSLKPNARKLCLESVIHKPIDINEIIDKVKETVAIVHNRNHAPEPHSAPVSP